MELDAEGEKTMTAAMKGYAAYAKYTGGKSAVSGEPLPNWFELPAAVKNAWFAAAKSIREV